MVLSSTKADTFVLAELAVPWEDRIGQSNTLKEDRYMELTLDLQQKGYKVWFFTFEVGARGMVGHSTYTFLREIGLTSKIRSKAWQTCPELQKRLRNGFGLREIASDLPHRGRSTQRVVRGTTSEAGTYRRASTKAKLVSFHCPMALLL